MVVWEYDLPLAASAVSWTVNVNNIAALEILLDCGYVRAIFLVALGAAGRAVVGWSILSGIGLNTESMVSIPWPEGWNAMKSVVGLL